MSLTSEDFAAKLALEPRPITVADRQSAVPEKMELIDGYLCDEAERLRLLQVLLINVGLRQAVRLAPRALWLQALE